MIIWCWYMQKVGDWLVTSVTLGPPLKSAGFGCEREVSCHCHAAHDPRAQTWSSSTCVSMPFSSIVFPIDKWHALAVFCPRVSVMLEAKISEVPSISLWEMRERETRLRGPKRAHCFTSVGTILGIRIHRKRFQTESGKFLQHLLWKNGSNYRYPKILQQTGFQWGQLGRFVGYWVNQREQKNVYTLW